MKMKAPNNELHSQVRALREFNHSDCVLPDAVLNSVRKLRIKMCAA